MGLNEEFIKDKIDKCEYLEKFKIENYKTFKFKTRITTKFGNCSS